MLGRSAAAGWLCMEAQHQRHFSSSSAGGGLLQPESSDSGADGTATDAGIGSSAAGAFSGAPGTTAAGVPRGGVSDGRGGAPGDTARTP